MADEPEPNDDCPDLPFLHYEVVPLDGPNLDRANLAEVPPSNSFPKVEVSPLHINLETIYGWNLKNEVPSNEETLAGVEGVGIPLKTQIQNQLVLERGEPVLVLPTPKKEIAYRPGLFERLNHLLGLLFLQLFRFPGRVLGYPLKMISVCLVALIHPFRTLESILSFIEPRLPAGTAVVIGLGLLAGSGGLLFWLLDSLTWIHLSRLIPAIGFVPLMAWMGVRNGKSSLSRQFLWFLGGCFGALLCWWFVPTLGGHHLWSASNHVSRIQKQLQEMTPGLFARFQEGRMDRLALVVEFPQFLPRIQEEEDTWIRKSILIETESLEKRKLNLESVRERMLRLHQNLQLLAEKPLVPNQIHPFRLELFRLRLEKSREAAEQLIKKNRYREAYDQVVRPTGMELEEEARYLGTGEELVQFRDSFETLAKLAELASNPNR